MDVQFFIGDLIFKLNKTEFSIQIILLICVLSKILKKKLL